MPEILRLTMENTPRGPWPGRVLSLTVLIGAFLLFQVQPLMSKRILPWFGGGPAVWTTCMLFFQSALFAGYAFAHLGERHGSPALNLVLQLGLILGAVLLLPIVPDEAWKRAGAGDPTWTILLLLAVHVGAPYLALSTTGPLVQAWYARAYPDRSPYRLYALSNAGSLAALLTYPVVFEPLWGLDRQSILWTGTFLLFAVLYAAGAIWARRLPSSRTSDPVGAEEIPAPSRGRVALWIVLPAFASWMLLASTNQLCQDLVVMPFLWVLPLAVYLMSFIVSFDRPRWYKPTPYALSTMGLVIATTYMVQANYSLELWLGIGAALATLFCLCMLCHGELARLKPAPRRLTGYYLAIAGGGALGGLFVSLVAPLVFSTFFEWALGMAAAYAAACGRLAWIHRDRIRAHKVVATVLFGIASAGLVLVELFSECWRPPLEATRNYYGVVTVTEPPPWPPLDRPYRDMYNGPILHGRQYLNEDDRLRPTTYYIEASGVGRALSFYQDRQDLRVGVVGLGVGTLAAYATHPSQSFRFYEINPEVVRLARKHFTYLKDCKGKVDVVLGDARVSLAGEPPRRFHALVLDAFSGDTIPTHLLTAEAMGIYVRHLDPEGTIAIHTSNHHMDLNPVVRGAAHRYGLKTVEIEYTEGSEDIGDTCSWVLCVRSEPAYQALSRGVPKVAGAREIVWTDDHTNLLSVLKLR